ncbi:MAG: hypothetical protein DMF01_07695 [Verrucomicrobia bacterium]|nr:MAG: hypothetical protein DMF01_07695 [Verrucomicrobiota bacterium]
MRGFIFAISRSGGLQSAVPRDKETNPCVHLAIAQSEHFFWISQTPGGCPLVVQLPSALQKRCAFSESIRAPQEHDHQVTRIHSFHLPLANNFRLTIRIQNQTLAGSR